MQALELEQVEAFEVRAWQNHKLAAATASKAKEARRSKNAGAETKVDSQAGKTESCPREQRSLAAEGADQLERQKILVPRAYKNQSKSVPPKLRQHIEREHVARQKEAQQHINEQQR